MSARRFRDAAPILIVAALIAVALVLVAASRFRRGATALSGAMLLTAILRATLSTEQMGPLAVRGQRFDVLFCGGLGLLLLWLVIVE